ncbi:hypothetical protein F5148DRAFT_1222532 [Russula earlei]|uniref:Uncharacterized protein n=1 Tax=Russula earlei TaxID=71964 RepID=A0ACC0U256_9AGAM|nr:hypothetical protein F5148DRAFT_1222532 [Russula earlei]
MATANTADLALPLPSPLRTPESSTSSLPPNSTSKPPAKSRPAPTSNQDDSAPRKRSRSDMTPDERKEARAHRNRIAAQNSRDKRKAQFSALEARISELEAENRALRAGMAYPLPIPVEHRADDAAREADNRALRERVQALESAWEAIIRTLHTHGTTAGLPTVLPPLGLEQSSAPSSPSASASSPSPESPTTTFPVLVPSTPIFSIDDPVFPLSPALSNLSLPSGTPSQSIFDLTHEPTCHSAAGGPLQADEDPSMLSDVVTDETIDEAAMDDLFHEILAAPLTPSSVAPILMRDDAEVPGRDRGSINPNTDAKVAKEVEREIQKLFDMMPVGGSAFDGVSPLPAEENGSTALELDLGAWEASIGLAQPVF